MPQVHPKSHNQNRYITEDSEGNMIFIAQGFNLPNALRLQIIFMFTFKVINALQCHFKHSLSQRRNEFPVMENKNTGIFSSALFSNTRDRKTQGSGRKLRI